MTTKEFKFFDVFEKLTITANDIRKMWYYDENVYRYYGSRLIIDSTQFVDPRIKAFVRIDPNGYACYFYTTCLEQNCETICLQSVRDTETPFKVSSDHFGDTDNTTLCGSIPHDDGTIEFTWIPDGVLGVRRDSPLKFKDENDFTLFVRNLYYDGWDLSVIRSLKVPVNDDGTFDSSRGDDVVMRDDAIEFSHR